MANILTPRMQLPELNISHTADTFEGRDTNLSNSPRIFPEQRGRSTEWCCGVQTSTTSYGAYSGKMSALNNLEEEMIPPYLGAQSYSYSTTAVLPQLFPDSLLPDFHSRKVSTSERSSAHYNEAGLSAPVFLSKFKGISRSRSPNALRTSSVSTLSAHPNTGSSVTSMVELPRTPTSGSIVSGSGSSTYSGAQWSPEPASPVTPRSRYNKKKKKGGLLKGSFSPTPGRLAPKAKGSKGSVEEEFDPTTIRKHRTIRRKNPQDLYDQYDDLFTDEEEALGEQDPIHSAVHLSETEYEHYSGSDDGYHRTYKLGRLKHTKPWPDAPRSPPRSVPSPSSSHPNLKVLPPSPFLLSKWNASDEIATPPHSKPPSVTDLRQASVPAYDTPPTPPSPSKTGNSLLKKSGNPEAGRHSPLHPEAALPPACFSPTDKDLTASSLPGPPPGHAPPPVPDASRRLSNTSKRESVRSNNRSEKQEDNAMDMDMDANALGMLNVPSDTSVRYITPSPPDATGPQAGSVASLFSETVTGESPHRIPRKRVGSSSKVETLDNLMSAAKEIGAHVGGEDMNMEIGSTGYTPQMRISDVCDLENEFAFAHFTDFTPTTPTDTDTTKEMVNPSPGSSAAIHTMKEVTPQSLSALENDGAKGTEPEDLNKADKPDGTPLRVFRQFLKSSGERDAFIQRSDRFDALQTQRICTHLRNDYQVVPIKKAKQAEEQSATSSRIIKQREVADKMLTSMWAMMSFRWMAFGRLLVSPAHGLLIATCGKKSTGEEPHLSSGTTSEKGRKRILDLGGIPVGDWGWHCAYDYPRSKVYTVTSRTVSIGAASAPENDTPGQSARCRGPKNHRHITVSYLWRLPFPDNHFDVVSARSLFMALKIHPGVGRSSSIDLMSPLNIMDEYDLCLEECLRILKPGGYLEYFLLDNDIVNPGPLAVELSTKFTNELQANAFDPYPTRKWIKRLNKAGYGDMKRAWLFLPMAPQVKPKPPSKDDEYELKPQAKQHLRSSSLSNNVDAVKEEVRRKLEAWEDLGTMKGSTESVAPVTGLVGSWLWESWMLKTSAEAQKDSDWKLSLDTIGNVLDEGRDMKSGWRVMLGWARKPLATDPYTYERKRADSANSAFSAV